MMYKDGGLVVGGHAVPVTATLVGGVVGAHVQLRAVTVECRADIDTKHRTHHVVVHVLMRLVKGKHVIDDAAHALALSIIYHGVRVLDVVPTGCNTGEL